MYAVTAAAWIVKGVHDEEEILFAIGSIFRVQYIETLDKINNIPVIYLTLIDRKEFLHQYSIRKI